ncbi:MAG: dTDP-4-dehydrorhamnose reductase [Gammaproteobacteria bacterium]|nr:dTDP-4-dehydrorhamnose reductase [Gammaproteobacteria bacterium]
MKMLLLGANGQVGWELQRSLAPLGELKICNRFDVDLADLDKLRTTLRDYQPDVIVNAAAYTAVDKAESEAEQAEKINHTAVALLAKEAKHLNAWLIHYSTDYVFDGEKQGAYIETDPTHPQSVYGSSKCRGEEAIRNSGCQHLIFRTCWVFAARGNNFAKTILKLAKQHNELKIISDQYGAPTSAELIADVTALCLYRLQKDPSDHQEISGTYHLSAAGESSWFEFAQYVIAQAEKHGFTLSATTDKIRPIQSDEYPQAATRPKNSRLSSQKLSKTFGIVLPIWQTHVKRLITELAIKENL